MNEKVSSAHPYSLLCHAAGSGPEEMFLENPLSISSVGLDEDHNSH